MQLLMFTEEGAHSTLDPDCRLSVNYPNFPQMIEIHPTNFLKRLRPNQELHPLTNSSSKQHYLKTVHRYVAPQGCVSQEGNHTRLRAVPNPSRSGPRGIKQ